MKKVHYIILQFLDNDQSKYLAPDGSIVTSYDNAQQFKTLEAAQAAYQQLPIELRELMHVQSIETKYTAHREAVGTMFRKVRKMQGLNQTQLADKLGVTISYISQVENGQSNVTIDTMYSFASALGCAMDFRLVSYDGQVATPNVKVTDTGIAPDGKVEVTIIDYDQETEIVRIDPTSYEDCLETLQASTGLGKLSDCWFAQYDRHGECVAEYHLDHDKKVVRREVD